MSGVTRGNVVVISFLSFLSPHSAPLPVAVIANACSGKQLTRDTVSIAHRWSKDSNLLRCCYSCCRCRSNHLVPTVVSCLRFFGLVRAPPVDIDILSRVPREHVAGPLSFDRDLQSSTGYARTLSTVVVARVARCRLSREMWFSRSMSYTIVVLVVENARPRLC